MTEPMPLPAARAAAGIRRGVVACLTVAAGTVLLGVVAGFLWAVAAPRPLLLMTGRGTAAVINAETSAFIAADGWYCFICLAGGVLTGLAGYLLAVRSYGPVAMIMVLVSALAAALVTLWIGQHVGLATYHHLLATLPPGAKLRAALSLGARSAIAFWPLGAGLMAGGMELAGVGARPAGGLLRIGPGPGMTAGNVHHADGPGTCPGALRTLGGCFPGLICADRRLPS